MSAAGRRSAVAGSRGGHHARTGPDVRSPTVCMAPSSSGWSSVARSSSTPAVRPTPPSREVDGRRLTEEGTPADGSRPKRIRPPSSATPVVVVRSRTHPRAQHGDGLTVRAPGGDLETPGPCAVPDPHRGPATRKREHEMRGRDLYARVLEDMTAGRTAITYACLQEHNRRVAPGPSPRTGPQKARSPGERAPARVVRTRT